MRFRNALLCAAAAALLTYSAKDARASSLIVLHNFSSSTNSANADGSAPLNLFISGGTLFGTANESGENGTGDIFELSTNGTGFTDVHTFTSERIATNYVNQDGAMPVGVVVNGNTIYGTTSEGGTHGFGTIFSVNIGGTGFSNLYNFTNGADGASPSGGLVQIGNGLYGTTTYGGVNGNGTIFGIYANGAGFSVLHAFSEMDTNLANSDGANPECTLAALNNRLYGTAIYGGVFGAGSVYSVAIDGTGFETLHSFAAVDNTTDANAEGANPEAGLALTNGVLFGTASEGGTNAAGTVFSLNINGTGFQNLYNFSELPSVTNADGASPQAALSLSTNAIYGTTALGGADGNGTIFALTMDGSQFLVVHTFTGGSDGGMPGGGMVWGGGQTLYGTTEAGGAGGSGTVFELVPGPLGPPLIISNLASQNVNQGSPLTLQIFSIGAGDLSYQWNFNGKNIAHATNDAYVIKKAEAANNGNYFVTVSGAGGVTTSAVATVTVFIPPAITSEPASKAEPAGGIATFTVKATGSPLEYQWYFDGNALTDGAGISGVTSNELVINPVAAENVGSYFVVVGNGITSKTSKTVVLTSPVEKTKPAVAITSPKAASRTNAPVLSGTASDSVRIVSVAYWVTNLNPGVVSTPISGEAILAAGKGTATNWTIPLEALALLPGTNVLAVQSTNVAGLASALEKVSFFYKVPSVFGLSTNGSGTVTGTASEKGDTAPADQALLNIGERYTVTAKGAKNWLFQNWTTNSAVAGTNATLSFVMEPGLNLTATFVTNFFVGMAGRYDGIFYPSPPQIEGETNSGLICNLVVKTNGAYSGKVYLASATPYSISGSFNASGAVTKTITRSVKAGGNITLSLEMSLGVVPRLISGYIESTGWASSNLNLFAAAGALDDTKSWSMLLSDTNQTDAPPNYGYALATNISQMIHMGGALSDGTKFTPMVEPINEANQFPVYASLYANTGLALGMLSLDASTNSDTPTGALLWFKPQQRTGLYSNAFSTTLVVDGSPWTNSATAMSSMAGEYQLTFSGGGFPSDIANTVQLSSSGALTLAGPGADFTSGIIKPADGLLTLTFTNALNKRVIASGTFLQNANLGGGFFAGSTNSGTFLLRPNPQ